MYVERKENFAVTSFYSQQQTDTCSHKKMLFLCAVALLLHLSACSAGDPCPSKAALAPCTCTYVSLQNWTLARSAAAVTHAPDSTPLTRPDVEVSVKRPFSTPENETNDSAFTVVDCKVSKTITALEETISSALNRKLVDKLIVANVPPQKEHTLARLPSGWLKKVRVRQFEILESKVSGDFIWYGNPFEGQERSLLWFSANECSLTGSLTYDTAGTVNTKGLNGLPLLQGVDFSNNYLTTIMALSFRYPPANLSTVILSHNSIEFIEGGTFNHILLLKYIDLSHNLLESLGRSIFASPARNLEQIDLSWNSLTALTTDFFVNMPALKIVNISNNFLYSMPDRPWAAVWKQLVHIDVLGNFVECNCDLMWLLSILSPPVVNISTTAAPRPLPGQIVKGVCSKTIQPRIFAINYDLVTLTRDRLTC